MSAEASIRPADTRAEARAMSAAVNMAGHAPSIGNTQPSRWLLSSDGLHLHLDDSRAPDVTDSGSRLAVLSCGVALHHALLSLAAEGWHTVVTRLPDPAHPDHLARLRLDHRIPVSLEARRHRQTIDLRRTDRRPTMGDPVDAGKLQFIAAAVESAGAGLHLLRPDQAYDLAGAADQAERSATEDAARQAEAASWTGGPRLLGTATADGAIPARTMRTTVPGRDFGRRGDLPGSEAPDNAAAFAVLFGTGDGQMDWLRTGEALSAAWLTATELGLRVLPLSATVELAVTRERICGLLPGLGRPHLVLRFTTGDPAGTPRPPGLSAVHVIERD